MATSKKALAVKDVKAVLTGKPTLLPVNPAVAIAMTQHEVLPSGYKVKKILTLPSLVMKKAGEARALKFIEPIHTSLVKGKPRADGTYDPPASVAQVIDLDTGEALVFLLPAVVKKNIEDGYPDESYVGKAFFIKNMGKRKSDQRYVDFGIAEIEVSQ